MTFGYNESLISYPKLNCDEYNLKIWYKFDGNSDDSNYTTTKYDLTNNGVTFVNGIVNQAASFDNNADLLTTSSFNLTDLLGQNFTWTFWVKIKSGIAQYGQLVHFDNGTDGLYFRRINADRLHFWIQKPDLSGNYFTLTSSDYIIDTWRYYTITYNNTEAKLYLDGILHETVATNNTLNIGNGTLRIGDRNNNDQSFMGEFDDFRVYNKDLSQEEVTSLYTQYNQTKYEINFSNPTKCDILIVGGGGAGGGGYGGGGGGGGVLYATDIELNGTYTIKVGDGGKTAIPINPDAYNPTNSGNGYSSEFGIENDMVEVLGGGYGGNAGQSGASATNGGSGGSGGGGVYSGGSGGTGTSPIYNTFITSTNSIYYGGNGGSSVGNIGGGGGGASGIIPTNYNGADGIQVNMGNNYYCGGGGGGIYWENTAGSGGLGGGGGAGGLTGMGGLGGLGGITNGEDGTGAGSGSTPQGIGGNGGAGTGGGGGGDAYSSPNKGGNGGSGIVIIRYKETYENKNNLISIKNNNNNGITINNKDYIGINNDYPTNTFDINGNININNNENKTALILTQNTNLPIVDIKKNNDSILFIDNLGNIGINNKLPQKNLHIEVDTLINDNDLIIMNGNIGIGTDNFSQHKLHVIGNTNIDGDLNVSGGLTISGGQTTIDTDVYTTEQLSITNDGTGPALLINQNGTGNILDIKEHDNTILFIKDSGNIGIGTNEPEYELDIRRSSPMINLYGKDNNDIVGLELVLIIIIIQHHCYIYGQMVKIIAVILYQNITILLNFRLMIIML